MKIIRATFHAAAHEITIKDEFIFLIPISINGVRVSGSIDLVDLSINGKSIVF